MPYNTEEDCVAEMRQHGLLFNVPDRLRTEAVCATAVQQNGLALDDVPEHLRTEAVCVAAMQQNGSFLYLVPEHLRTDVVCMTAVQQDGHALGDVPGHVRTKEIFFAAMRQNGFALMLVPSFLRTEALCIAAVGQNGNVLQRVPEDERTEAMYRAAMGATICPLNFSKSEANKTFFVRQRVKCRNPWSKRWCSGYVTSLNPTTVTPDGWDSPHVWAEVKDHGDEALTLHVGDM